jgi:hypothetical protein
MTDRGSDRRGHLGAIRLYSGLPDQGNRTSVVLALSVIVIRVQRVSASSRLRPSAQRPGRRWRGCCGRSGCLGWVSPRICSRSVRVLPLVPGACGITIRRYQTGRPSREQSHCASHAGWRARHHPERCHSHGRVMAIRSAGYVCWSRWSASPGDLTRRLYRRSMRNYTRTLSCEFVQPRLATKLSRPGQIFTLNPRVSSESTISLDVGRRCSIVINAGLKCPSLRNPYGSRPFRNRGATS